MDMPLISLRNQLKHLNYVAGSTSSWAFVLQPRNGTTRLLFRRQASHPSLFDRIVEPGYLIMDWAMLRGIRKQAEQG
jgi:hypothetical protein